MKLRILALIALFTCCLFADKRPLTHADSDSWRHIQDQHLSDDGHYLAYAIFPQEGDGELVVRNLVTGKEWREPLGELPPPPPASFADPNPEGPPPVRGVSLAFTHDSRTLVFSTFPARADNQKAKRDKKKPEEMPKEGMVVMDLGSGAVARVPGVKNFQVMGLRWQRALLPPADGSVLYKTVAMPVVTVGGVPATILYSGLAPGFPGEYQVDIQVPAGVTPGDDVPVTITISGSATDTVTISVQPRG